MVAHHLSEAAPAKSMVLIPALNEERTVASVVRAAKDCPQVDDVLVVDDGSTDRTAVRAENAGAMVLRLPFNVGVGGAVRAGYRHAQRGGYTSVVQLDADGQHDPADIETMLDLLADWDLVVASRFAHPGAYSTGFARARAIWALSRVVSHRSSSRLSDVTSGFRATGRRGIDLFADHYPIDYLNDTVESLLIASSCGMRITEVPVKMYPRLGGIASQSPRKSATHLLRTCSRIVLGAAIQDAARHVHVAEELATQAHGEGAA